ncbi:hypothetical protein PV326_002021 [Microctonus aethiopoides]|nr:hypothetical protein PV326_002021 [Microctonus aethiopoides]
MLNKLFYSFEEGKSDKEILDNLLMSTRYDKRLLPPVQAPTPTSSAPIPSHISTTQPQFTAHISSKGYSFTS